MRSHIITWRTGGGAAAAISLVILLVILFLAVSSKNVEPNGGKYPWHPGTTASVFSSAENATPDNAFISNAQSAWDKDWRAHAPHENPFYLAVPYADYLENGAFNPDNVRIPWHKANVRGQSELKNHWVQVDRKVGGKTLTVFGQVEDVGPSSEVDSQALSDPDYVFGPRGQYLSQAIRVKPKNTFGVKAGIDLSQSMADALQLIGSGTITWRFVDANDVPPGPWKSVITVSSPNW